MITKFVTRKDEFQYLIDADRTIVSVFQRIWDLYLKGSNIFLILFSKAGFTSGFNKDGVLLFDLADSDDV